ETTPDATVDASLAERVLPPTSDAQLLPADALGELEPVYSTSTASVRAPVEGAASNLDSQGFLTGAYQPSLREQVVQWLELGDEALARDRLTVPRNRNALHYYRRVFELDAYNPLARQGVERVAERYGRLAWAAIGRDDYRKAHLFTERGLKVAATNPILLDVQQDLVRHVAAVAAQAAEQANAAARPEPVQPTQAESTGGLFGALKRMFGEKKKDD
ncbi:MAG: hypothetical protein ACK5HY_00040, partial [Parahaliea sp.]